MPKRQNKYPASLDTDPVCHHWHDLGISTRGAHCLRNFGISSIAEMRAMDWHAFAKSPNVGKLVLRECLGLLGLTMDDALGPCRHIPSDQMARELRRRGWSVAPPQDSPESK